MYESRHFSYNILLLFFFFLVWLGLACVWLSALAQEFDSMTAVEFHASPVLGDGVFQIFYTSVVAISTFRLKLVFSENDKPVPMLSVHDFPLGANNFDVRLSSQRGLIVG